MYTISLIYCKLYIIWNNASSKIGLSKCPNNYFARFASVFFQTCVMIKRNIRLIFIYEFPNSNISKSYNSYAIL